MPVFTATTGNETSSSEIWSHTMATGTGCTARTMFAVSDTTQVTAVSPCTWKCWNVLRSAWMPAPAEQSEPAIVIATGTVFVMACS